MSDPITSSISKGCFLIKGNKQPKKAKKRKQTLQDTEQLSMLLPQCEHESKSERMKRVEMMNLCWQQLHHRITDMMNSKHDEVISSLTLFTKHSHAPGIEGVPETSRRIFREIPTAVLLTGVNLPDHSAVFSELVHKLQDDVSPYVCVLHSKDCSNFRFLLRAAMEGLYKAVSHDDASEFEDDSDASDEDTGSAPQKKRKKANTPFQDFTLAEFSDWYKAQMLENLEEAENTVRPPVVIILEDFEGFSVPVLEDLILSCCVHLTDVPFVFVFGVATTLNAVHRMLPHAVSTRLGLNVFEAQPSLNCLADIVDQVLIAGTSPFKLGPKVTRLLYEHFLYHDLSISSFVKGLKYSVMQHFFTNPVSILCHHDSAETRRFIQSRNSAQLEQYQHLPSVAKFVDRKSLSDQEKFRTNGKFAKETFAALIVDFRKKETFFFPVLKCLFIILSKLPKQPLGKRLRDLYEKCADKTHVTREKSYETSITLIRMLSRDELQPALCSCLEVFAGFMSDQDLDVSDIEDVKKLYDLYKTLETLDESIHVSQPSDSSPSMKPNVMFKDRYEFKKSLQSAVKEQKKQSPFELLRNDIVSCLDRIFKKHLISPLSLPFHEIFYFNDYLTVQQCMNGAPRLALQTALLRPASYLKCQCCAQQADGIHAKLPDICILYQLHLECGRLINVYDWLQAFVSIVSPVDEKGVKKKAAGKKANAEKEKLNEQLHARFIRGVSELQFMGFIKSTKRKTDHVQRLTWGGC